jgi:hypothetical protein
MSWINKPLMMKGNCQLPWFTNNISEEANHSYHWLKFAATIRLSAVLRTKIHHDKRHFNETSLWGSFDCSRRSE